MSYSSPPESVSKDLAEIIDKIIKSEGREYTNRRNDRGGPTKFGITIWTLSEWRNRQCLPKDVEALEEDEAREIYEWEFIKGPRFFEIRDRRLRYLIVDAGVLSGPPRVSRWLQEAINTVSKTTLMNGPSIAEDGIVGDRTLAALNAVNPARVVLVVVAIRIRFLGELVTEDHSQAENAHGWMNRATETLLAEVNR